MGARYQDSRSQCGHRRWRYLLSDYTAHIDDDKVHSIRLHGIMPLPSSSGANVSNMKLGEIATRAFLSLPLKKASERYCSEAMTKLKKHSDATGMGHSIDQTHLEYPPQLQRGRCNNARKEVHLYIDVGDYTPQPRVI